MKEIEKKKVTDAPEIFLEISALMILSITIKRKLFVQWGHKKIFPNLWAILIAKSTLYRKSTVLDLTKSFIDQEDIFPHEYSSELLIKEIAFKRQGIFIMDEIISPLKLWEKEYAVGVKSLLVSLYDCESEYKRKTLQYTYEIKMPFINIFAGSTPAWIQKSIKEEDLTSGFLPRFLLIYVYEKKNISYPYPGEFEENSQKIIRDCISLLKEKYKDKEEQKLGLSTPAKKILADYADLMNKRILEQGNGLSIFYSRLLIYVLKFSILYFISNSRNIGKNTIDKYSVKRAVNLIENIRKRTEKLLESLSFSKYQVIRNKVINILEEQGEIKYSDLLRKIKIKTRELREILETLEDEELIETLKEPDGRKPIIIKLKAEKGGEK
ncbi:MAG TPA: DUF3987 domain-containing protein [bacterium]|nr:DUF3987 domain-containing protein [bacterium]